MTVPPMARRKNYCHGMMKTSEVPRSECSPRKRKGPVRWAGNWQWMSPKANGSPSPTSMCGQNLIGSRPWSAEIEPLDETETVVAVTGRTVFGHAGDVVSRVRSVEIARKYRARPRKTSLANGPCSMFHRKLCWTIGGFNPEWYHAEDMEVSLAPHWKMGVRLCMPHRQW